MSEPLRVLLVGDYDADPRLGSSKVYYKLRDGFRALGHQCDLMLRAEIGERPRAPKMRWAVAPWIAARSVGRVARNYDVIDVASAEGAGLAVRRALTPRARYALVSRSHGLEQRNYERMLADATAGLAGKPWYRRVWYPAARLSQVALAARLCDRLLVLNAREADYAIARGWKPRDRVDVVAHGVSAGFLESAPAPDAPRGEGLLFCGTWDDVKGVSYLAAAFAQLHATRPDARLTVLGPGRPADAVLASFPAAARGRVRVVGRLDERDVMAAYRVHDALVFPSTYEGFGMVVVEAMSQRLPVIATPVGCVPDLVRDGETGLVVAPRSADALAAAMGRLLDDPARRRRLAEAAFRQVGEYTWAHTAERTLDCYRRAIADRRGGR